MCGEIKEHINIIVYANDNRNVVYHHVSEIKRKLDEVDRDLFMLENLGIESDIIKKQTKKYLNKKIDEIKDKIDKITD